MCLCLCSIADLRQNVSREHEVVKKKELDQGPKASYGYGGKFGVEKDRMDKVRLKIWKWPLCELCFIYCYTVDSIPLFPTKFTNENATLRLKPLHRSANSAYMNIQTCRLKTHCTRFDVSDTNRYLFDGFNKQMMCWIFPGCFRAQLCGRGRKALIPDRCSKGFRGKIWCTEGPCGQG